MTQEAMTAGPAAVPLPTGPARRRLPASERMPQILDAAFAEFAERGYAGASMAGAASRAGVAKGLIYHYFPGKAELFKAVVRSAIQPAFAEAEALLADQAGPRAALLRRLVETGYRRVATEPRQRVLFKLLLAEAGRFPELAEFYQAEVLARSHALLRDLLRAGVAAGEFRPEVAELPALPAVLTAPVAMASVWHIMLGEGRAPDLAAMQEAHLALLLDALQRRPG